MDIDVKALINLLDSKLYFRTSNGEFEGILKLIMVKKQRVSFEHAYYLPSHRYMGTMHVKFCDFLACRLLESSEKILDSSKFDSIGKELFNGDLEKRARIDESVDVADMDINFNEHLPPHLQNICPQEYCFMESVCPEFFHAIDYISGLKTIGISFHGPDLYRNSSLSFVCIATPKSVFIFDMDRIGIAAFHQGIQRIIEDENIEKIVHDCRESARCLRYIFQTRLNNVFDTQLADYLINMQRYTGEAIFKYVGSLDSCLVKYLKVPQQFLYNRNKCLSKDAEIQFYKIRPVSDEFRSILIKSAVYLLSLKEKQEQLLLYPFHQVVDIYLNHLREAPEAEVFKKTDECIREAPDCLSECTKIVQFCVGK